MEAMTDEYSTMPLERLTHHIKSAMHRSAKDAVRIGYMLRRVMEGRLYLETYGDFDTYLEKELHMDYSLATRFIKINRKYSQHYLPGGGMELAPEYQDYSQGLLIEMLNMTPEQEAKVTPDMTVKQAREIKRQAKKPDPVPEKKEVIIDGEFREIEPSKKVATSQLEQDDTFAEQENLEQDSPEESESDEESTEDYKSIEFARRILQENQKLLQDYLDVDGLPEETVERQRLITAALAAAVCDLEESEDEPDQEKMEADQEPIQLPILRNTDQRKEWLANYKAWGLWYRDEHIDVNYYKYDFSDGSRLVVAEYPQRSDYWDGRKKVDEHYYHLLEKNRVDFNKRVYNAQYGQSTDSETYLIDFLKRLQKGGKS